MSEPRWLDAAFVADANRRLVEHSGEPYLLRDAGLLESALMVPRNRWHYEAMEDIGALGLALAVAIGRNHPFEQGNKRTAWLAMLTFFALNEVVLSNDDDENHATVFVDVLTGAQPPESLLARLQLASFS